MEKLNSKKQIAMEIPKGVELYETARSIAWIDENGILCSISKKAPPPTLEETDRDLEKFKKQFGNRKWCMILDVTNASPNTKETRDYAAKELPKLVKAMAMISNSALGRMVANLFFGLKPPPYPAKMFSNEREAKEWLKQYLQS